MRVAVVGATGLVGTTMLKVLAQRNFPVTELIPVASERSVGKTLMFKGQPFKVVSMETAIERAMTKLGLKGRAFQTLSDAEQRQVYLQIIESAGKSDAVTTAKIPRLRNAGRVLWLATLLIAAYNIGTSENPWWQTGREAANVAGGAGT